MLLSRGGRVAFLKGLIMVAFGAGVLVQMAFEMTHGLVPTAVGRRRRGIGASGHYRLCSRFRHGFGR